MSYKPIVWGLGIIFIIGLLLSSIITPFIDIEEETKNVWSNPIADVFGAGIDFFKYVVVAVPYTIEFIGNIFGSSEDRSIIYISGTGEHNNKTLDGEYVQVSDKTFENKIERRFLFFWDLAQIKLKTNEDNDLTDVNLTTNFHEEDVIYKPSNISKDEWWKDWNLEATNLTYNPTAEGETSNYLTEKPLSSSQKIIDFFDDTKDRVKTNINIIGLIPSEIGIPLFIIIIFGFIYAIIRIFPFT